MKDRKKNNSIFNPYGKPHELKQVQTIRTVSEKKINNNKCASKRFDIRKYTKKKKEEEEAKNTFKTFM